MTPSGSAHILGGLEPALFRLLEIDGESFFGCADLRFRHFLSYYGRLAATRGAYPSRSAIDPSALGTEMLPNLFLVDVLRGEARPVRYRFRLVGEAITDLSGARAGRYLEAIATGTITAVDRHYAAAIRGEIYLHRSELGWQNNRRHGSATLVLPLADNGKLPTHLFGLSVHHYALSRD